MAREKNTVPTTLISALKELNQTLADYSVTKQDFEELVAKGDHDNAAKALADGHALVLKLKDLHNGLYQFNKAAKTEKPPKEHAAITMAKEAAAKHEKNDTEDVTEAAKNATAEANAKAKSAAKPQGKAASTRTPIAKGKSKSVAKGKGK